MNRKRFFVVVLVGALIAAVCIVAGRTPQRFATPLDCLEAYRDACMAGDGEAQLSCLTDEYRAKRMRDCTEISELGAWGYRSMEGLKSWVAQAQPTPTGVTDCVLDVEETRVAGTQVVRFHLRQVGRGWLISRIDPPRQTTTRIPFGTHISKVPEAQSSSGAEQAVEDPLPD